MLQCFVLYLLMWSDFILLHMISSWLFASHSNLLSNFLSNKLLHSILTCIHSFVYPLLLFLKPLTLTNSPAVHQSKILSDSYICERTINRFCIAERRPTLFSKGCTELVSVPALIYAQHTPNVNFLFLVSASISNFNFLTLLFFQFLFFRFCAAWCYVLIINFSFYRIFL